MKYYLILFILSLTNIGYSAKEYSYQEYKIDNNIAEERYTKTSTVKVVIDYYASKAKPKCGCSN